MPYPALPLCHRKWDSVLLLETTLLEASGEEKVPLRPGSCMVNIVKIFAMISSKWTINQLPGRPCLCNLLGLKWVSDHLRPSASHCVCSLGTRDYSQASEARLVNMNSSN